MTDTRRYEVRVRELEWEGAACVGADVNLFVNGVDIKKSQRIQNEYQAKKICKSCPLSTRMHCARYAVENHLEGVWGGYNDEERKALKVAKSILPSGRTRPRRVSA